jgi:cyclic beta-1,2-glucan synthetase
MKNGEVQQIILGFFPPGTAAPSDLLASDRRAEVFLIHGGDQNAPGFAAPYAGLRLPRESLLVARCRAGDTADLVQKLRAARTPSIFVLREEPSPAPATRPAQGAALLREKEEIFLRAQQDLEDAQRLDHALTSAAEWLLDNAYLVLTNLAEMRRNLPGDFSEFIDEKGKRRPVLLLARELAARSDFSVNAAAISAFLSDRDVAGKLAMRDLWMFPFLLRLALIEALTDIARRVNRSQQMREAAYLWSNRLAASARLGPEPFGRMLARMESEPYALDPHFLVSLAEQLQDEELALAPAQRWMESRLEYPLSSIVQSEHTREAAERISTANAFGSLRMLARLDFSEIFESVSVVEAELCKDPAGIYSKSDAATRDDCRRVVEKIAQCGALSEMEVARRALELAARKERGVMHFLLSSGIADLERAAGARAPLETRIVRGLRHHATPFYLGAQVVLIACFTALTLMIAWDAGVRGGAALDILGALALFPLSELSIQIVNALVISLLRPGRLPKLDFRKRIPDEDATLVIVPMMLASVEVARNEVEKLEIRFLANQDKNLTFGLFADFLDSPQASAPNDAELLAAVRQGVEDLNRRYPGERFVLFHRSREWSVSEQRWIGRERKRGKLDDLNSYLLTGKPEEILIAGHIARPIRYVLTLDSDTALPPGAARRLVETAAHPLNRVELDPKTRVRRSGYTIIQPRVSVSLPDATATRFTRIFADSSGTDPYCKAVSDAQQDLFGEAIFHGKAIYDVSAFSSALGGRFPAETLLSHDLIEGAYCGAALANDIELFENVPHNYSSFSRREHRWIRGDWQIARWILPRVPTPHGSEPNPLSLLNRWRIFDNLRRSLVPVASLLLLLLGWLISAAPGVWSLVVALAVAIPALAPLLERWARRIEGSVHGWQGAGDQLIRAGVRVAFLPHSAWIACDAIARALFRSHISRRNLLEWETAASAGANAHRHLNTTLRQMLMVCFCSVALLMIVAVTGAFFPAFAFLALWATSPILMLWLNEPGFPSRRVEAADAVRLRRLARRTWRFFDDLVTAENNWLPPDNSQLALRVEVARRTSPTNIGMWLASALAARDFGYLTADELWRRAAKTLETMQRMERYEGHLLNWYNIATLEPLNPRYVSTVDSGNLIASLWVLRRGCQDAISAPILSETCLRGLSDTLAMVRDACGRDAATSEPLRQLRRLFYSPADSHAILARLRLAAAPLARLTRRGSDERSYWISALESDLKAWTQIADRYLRWMETLADPAEEALGEELAKWRRRALHAAPSLRSLAASVPPALEAILARRGSPDLAPELACWLDQLAAEFAEAQRNAAGMVKNFESLADLAEANAAAMHMGFLYDKPRRLFAVGYAVGGPLEFTSHYDLLASECRLASLVAIAKGDVPVEHWFALGRTRSPADDGPALLSWSGTMFEYLMPVLFVRSFPGSLLDRACQQAVEKQIEYGRAENLPWGISESAFSSLDIHQVYQYRAFGVPALALKRETEPCQVVAPYATMLALMIDPPSAIDNLRRLESLGLGGPMGLYEAIDFSREKSPEGDRGVIVYTYMAHHQGMSLIALDNVLHGDAMECRFHAEPRVRAFESLLFERVPIARQPDEHVQIRHAPPRPRRVEEPPLWQEPAFLARTHLNGNGHYWIASTNSGAGFSRWNDFDITRWRSDATLQSWGTFIYVRDLKSQTVWATSEQPLGGDLGSASVTLATDRIQAVRRVSSIETITHVTVAPEDDVEIRRIVVTNRSLRSRQIEFTSYAELALAPHRADAAHPAFSKLFIETESPAEGVLIAHRRLRSPGDPPVWAAHVLTGASGIQFETDRARFLGRGNTPANPRALTGELSGTAGAVLDPVFSLRCRVTLEPRERREIVFLTIAAASREALLQLIEKYRRPDAAARAFEMAWTRAQLELRYLGVRPGAANRYHELAGRLLYPTPALRASAGRIARNRLGQSALWAYGISGDLPILTVTASDARGVALVRELLLAHNYWRLIGFKADLVILNQEEPSYDAPLREQLLRQIEAHSRESIDKPGGVFLRDWNAMPEEHRNLILASSAAVLHGNRGALHQQLVTPGEIEPPPPFTPSGAAVEQPSPPLPFLELPYFNGIGGFTKDGREYCVYLGRESERTPAPWVNVMANANFGAMVSESGLGCAWAGNSQTNRLTPWHNDPVSDPQSEIIYLRDDETGALWSPTALPIRENDAYRARHGQGYTIFEHNSHSIGQTLAVFVPPSDPVKIYRLALRNDSSRARRLTVTYFAEWLLGSVREDQQLHIATSFDDVSGAVLAVQTWSGAAGHVAFAAANPRAASWSADRAAFLGSKGSVARPAALQRLHLDGRVGPALDPAAALQLGVALEPGETKEITFVLGQAETVEAARGVIERAFAAGLDPVREQWDALCGALQVHTPILSVNLLLNRWLLYQALSCRFWGRTALYQSSGAFGFRDQLQDSLAFLYAAPHLTREHILACAARQFREGDVQHWWHPDTGLGVRTRCSDDLVWLPYATAHYINITGDQSILDEQIPFLDAPLLEPGEQEKMFAANSSSESAPLWEHCRRALDHAFKLGPHGLPLIGSGDWNDGLNHVGVEGRGESVWLAWFLAATLQACASILENRAADLARQWRARAADLASAVERVCWDGDWYLRGFFDDGTPLGSHVNAEMRIDSIAQSWAVLCGLADPEHARAAMESAGRLLVNDRDGLVMLFTPPFDHSTPHPGYIMGYPPGVRENGGQYTHGSLWMAMAHARLGDGDRAVHLLQLMNPVEHSRDPEAAARYAAEPYVSAADVYSSPDKSGRAGWTWYTGSAAWMYRIWIEEVLGFHLRGDRLTIAPAIPADWPGFSLVFRFRSATYQIEVRRAPGASEPAAIRLLDDGKTHSIVVHLPLHQTETSAEPALAVARHTG